MPLKRKIALFGGTFDPIHSGHLHLAEQAMSTLELDEVRFLPCHISPHKMDCPPASAADRLKMLRLATQNLPWAFIDDFELQNSGPSFSYMTAEAMQAKFPDADLFWIMGSDQWTALTKWKYPERIAAICHFIVLARGAMPGSQPPYRMTPLTVEHPASASEIRLAISRNQPLSAWLPSAVTDYIKTQQLYR